MGKEKVGDLKSEFLNDAINVAIKTVGLTLDKYKTFLKRSGLCYVGKIVEADYSIPEIKFTKEFQDWCFQNAGVLDEELTFVAMIEDENEYRVNKKRTRKFTRKD